MVIFFDYNLPQALAVVKRDVFNSVVGTHSLCQNSS